ncbi:hypothetical protein QLX08_000989 [Tetragonisca angustula]|uniref:Uncharacterized protein n=1 Tax=Tetragonisca angustula TaxID=166442 RepID=A0AAW1AJI7_9HYME
MKGEEEEPKRELSGTVFHLNTSSINQPDNKRKEPNPKKSRIDGFTAVTTHIRLLSARASQMSGIGACLRQFNKAFLPSSTVFASGGSQALVRLSSSRSAAMF